MKQTLLVKELQKKKIILIDNCSQVNLSQFDSFIDQINANVVCYDISPNKIQQIAGQMQRWKCGMIFQNNQIDTSACCPMLQNRSNSAQLLNSHRLGKRSKNQKGISLTNQSKSSDRIRTVRVLRALKSFGPESNIIQRKESLMSQESAHQRIFEPISLCASSRQKKILQKCRDYKNNRVKQHVIQQHILTIRKQTKTLPLEIISYSSTQLKNNQQIFQSGKFSDIPDTQIQNSISKPPKIYFKKPSVQLQVPQATPKIVLSKQTSCNSMSQLKQTGRTIDDSRLSPELPFNIRQIKGKEVVSFIQQENEKLKQKKEAIESLKRSSFPVAISKQICKGKETESFTEQENNSISNIKITQSQNKNEKKAQNSKLDLMYLYHSGKKIITQQSQIDDQDEAVSIAQRFEFPLNRS